MTGKVKWFNEAKGFGWLIPDDGSAEVFVHFSALTGDLKTLTTDQAVAFDVTQGPKGPSASSVRSAA